MSTSVRSVEPDGSSPTTFFGFDSSFLAKLERLTLLNRRPLVGPSAGPRRSVERGSSVEFADFRNYVPGDDFRRIDWNAYARLDRLFLRIYRAEQMSTVTLFLDHSPSMQFGQPSKVLTSGRLAAIFSYIALHNYDRVSIVGWGERVDRYLPLQTDRGCIPRVWKWIEEVANAPTAATDFKALRDYGNFRGRGLTIVISDFLTETDWRAGLKALRSRGQEVSVVQVLSAEELEPPMRGDWSLTDSESGAEVDVTLSPRLLKRYSDELLAHTTSIRDFCRAQGFSFVQLPSNIRLVDEALTSLRRVGVLG